MNGYFGGENYTVYSAAAAFDPYQQEVVLFGGCSALQCPSNQTWIYNGSEWANYTGLTGLTPPAVYGEGLTWDPQFTTIIMTGGILTSGEVTNTTWDFNGNDWQNMTRDRGADFFFGEGTAYAATAYDPALNQLVVVNGCANEGCTSIFDHVEVLTEAGGWTNGTHLLNPGTWHSEQFLWGSSMAYDPTDKELVLFGGVSYANNSTVNWTFILNGTGWYNITSTSTSCYGLLGCFYPGDRYGACETWDGQIGEVVLTGGYSDYSGTYYNDTWYFIGGTWSTSGSFESISGPEPEWGAAMPTNSSGLAPLEVGGEAYGTAYNTSWVLDIPPAPVITVLHPNPADVGATVTVNDTHPADKGSGTILYDYLYANSTLIDSSASSEVNLTDTYTISGTAIPGVTGKDPVVAVEVDYFVVYGYAYANISVNPALSASVIYSTSTTPTTTTSVTFNVTAIGGTPAYAYAWNFGDTRTGSSTATSHTFSAAGNYTVTVVITDSGGGRVTKQLVVTVTKAASSTSLLTYLTSGVGLYALVGVVVAAVVIALAVVMMRRKKGPATMPPSAQTGPTTPDASAATAGAGTPPPTPPPGAS